MGLRRLYRIVGSDYLWVIIGIYRVKERKSEWFVEW